jgi:hypothetical protein
MGSLLSYRQIRLIMKKWLSGLEWVLIIGMAFLPLVGKFPYRLNIFLSWEGAYRLYLGELPYRDFGIPLGFMYWVVPAVFFKVFGPYMMSLVKAQVFLNLVAGFSFRSISKSLQVEQPFRMLGVLLFVVSYSMLNYWPWYNHSVIVYQLLAFAFLFRFLAQPATRYAWVWLIAAALGITCSFFTKQDGGGMAILIAGALLVYDGIQRKTGRSLLIFTLSMIGFFCCFIIPFIPYDFNYWFNHGQYPHTARVAPYDLVAEFFSNSMWIRFYLVTCLAVVLWRFRSWHSWWTDRNTALFSLLTIGILVEAAIFQVTSYVPPDNNIFFHSFAFIFLVSMVAPRVQVPWLRVSTIVLLAAGIMLWWSHAYWRFVDGVAVAVLGGPKTGAGVVNKNTYLIAAPDSTDVPVYLWRESPHQAFKGMLMPPATVAGIDRILALPQIKQADAKVLNMSELTPLAYTAPFSLEKGKHYPLWYHQGVGMFQRETDMFCKRIQDHYYDVVIFEYIPYLNNFYPFEVRHALQKNYQKAFSFTAPRKPSHQAWVEVYIKMAP